MKKGPFIATLIAGLLLVGLSGTSLAQDLIADGEKVYRKCMACHAVGEGAKNKVGPELNNLYGRPAASVEGFKYSDVLIALGEAGLVWNAETVAGYVADPKKWLVETAPEYSLDCADLRKCRGKMAFAGLKKQEDIDALNAYLETFDDDVNSGS